MPKHRLDPLMNPRSVAYVGASETPGSPGYELIRVARSYDYSGTIYPINPKYETVQGIPCYGSLGELPAAPDLAILSVSSKRLEAQLEAAIEAGARAAVIYDTCYLPNDPDRKLLKRLRELARDADMAVCGGNGMGIVNGVAGFHSTFADVKSNLHPDGNATFITHSGSTFGEVGLYNPRVNFNTIVSAGQEIGATIDEYMDYALEVNDTTLLCLFVEMVRKPEAFMATLDKAASMGVPVVACKVGRSRKAAAFAQTHSGALVGNDAAYQAVFDHYGVTRVYSLDEMISTVTLMSSKRKPGPGGLSLVIDSGGERELVVDVAGDVGVNFAEINDMTVSRIDERLFHALEPVNPLDAWGDGSGYWEDDLTHFIVSLAEDPDTSISAMSGELSFNDGIESEYGKPVVRAFERTDKPVIVLANVSTAPYEGMARALTARGIPVLDGTLNGLKAIRHAFDRRDRLALPPALPAPECDPEVVTRWRARLADGSDLDEAGGYDLLRDFGVPVPEYRIAEDEAATLAGAETLGYPIVLKTAMPGIAHKSDVGGVVLDIGDATALADAYRDLASRLGPRVLVTPMVEIEGVEMVMGMVDDPSFGPIVMLGAGGVFVEIMNDVRAMLPPFGSDVARREIDRLKTRPLLGGARGRPAADIDALADALSRFSALVSALRGSVMEIDVNPLIAGPDGCIAVDVLVVRS
jgi:acetate---CoA ligase (ADP-forming)